MEPSFFLCLFDLWRVRVKKELCVDCILGNLSSGFKKGNNVKLQESIFACLLSWLKSGDICIMELKDSPLLDIAFQAIAHHPALFDIAVDIVCGMIYETREVRYYMPVIEVILPRLGQLHSLLSSEEDEDRLQGLCRVFAEAGEAYLDLIIDHPQQMQPVLEGVVSCLRLCPLRTLSTTFAFWYSFASCISSPDEKDRSRLFVPVFESTIEAIIGRLRFPLDDSDWSREEMDSFRDFRHEIGDILKDCALVLGGNQALAISLAYLQEYLTRHENGQQCTWQELEAILFSVRSMGSEVRPQDESSLRGIMELFPRLPAFEKVRYTATLVLSRYADWTNCYPELLPFQLNYIAQGLSFQEVAPASAMALESICKFCSKVTSNYLNQISHLS